LGPFAAAPLRVVDNTVEPQRVNLKDLCRPRSPALALCLRSVSGLLPANIIAAGTYTRGLAWRDAFEANYEVSYEFCRDSFGSCPPKILEILNIIATVKLWIWTDASMDDIRENILRKAPATKLGISSTKIGMSQHSGTQG